MTLRLVVAAATGNFAEALKALQKPVATAATAAIREAADTVKTRARAEIAGAGFSIGWQNAFRAQVFPKTGVAINAAAFFTHKIPYFNVFEEGATIAGKPFLWLPTKNVPLGRGKKPLTPKQYIDRVGPLISARGRQGNPILLGQGSRKSGILRATDRAVKVRKNAFKKGSLFGDTVPMFVGIASVTIGKKFDIKSIVKQVSEQLPEIYLRHLKANG